MILKNVANQNVCGLTAGVATGYKLYLSDGSQVIGTGAIATPDAGMAIVTLLVGEILIEGPVAVFFLNAGNAVIGLTNETIVRQFPGAQVTE